MMKTGLALVAVVALVACGGGDDKPRKMGGGQSPEVDKIVQAAKRSGTTSGRVEKGEAQSPEEVSEALHEYWVWPENGGPHNTLEEDHAACVERIYNDPTRKRRMKPIESLVLQVKCLEEKGWVAR